MGHGALVRLLGEHPASLAGAPWPVLERTTLAAQTSRIPGIDAGLGADFIPWLVTCPVWVTYLQRSKRVRVTFEHKVLADN